LVKLQEKRTVTHLTFEPAVGVTGTRRSVDMDGNTSRKRKRKRNRKRNRNRNRKRR
jgi:hypothetical protein